MLLKVIPYQKNSFGAGPKCDRLMLIGTHLDPAQRKPFDTDVKPCAKAVYSKVRSGGRECPTSGKRVRPVSSGQKPCTALPWPIQRAPRHPWQGVVTPPPRRIGSCRIENLTARGIVAARAC